MAQQNIGRVIVALGLVLVGLYLFGIQFVPALRVISINEYTWPLIIVGLGIAFLLAALLTWTPGLMVPASMLIGLGGLLFWQNATENWASWAYAWALLPGFAGVGTFLMNLQEGHLRQGIIAGGSAILLSAALFLIFGSFFGGINLLGIYWPIILILLGVIVLAQGIWRRTA